MAEQVMLPKAGGSSSAQKQIVAAFVIIFAVGVIIWFGIRLQEQAQNGLHAPGGDGKRAVFSQAEMAQLQRDMDVGQNPQPVFSERELERLEANMDIGSDAQPVFSEQELEQLRKDMQN